ncbi:unnamed protein product [Gulo gulo]|uniref:Uncharacterized protein n=1 Tax=Gulo gulo TaxID=48420 RepID=A0A9X9ME16_GULGU|nr:unnamed protein product [Gulo gulo]
MSKLSTTGGNPEALTIGCAEDSRARSGCPTLVTEETRQQSTFAQLLTMSPPRTTKLLWTKQPSWQSESPVSTPGCAVKKMNRQLVCISHLC